MARDKKKKKSNKKKKTVQKNGESSSGKEKTKIVVHTVNREEGRFMFGEFYIIDLTKEEMTELPYVLAGGDHGLNTMVSIGSTVYVVGGLNLECGKEFAVKPPDSATDNKKGILYHHGISFIDLNSPDSGWKSAPINRKIPDYCPAVVSLGGKIYTFSHSHYAGIFDPVKQKWKTLLPPPSPREGEKLLFDIDTRTEIIADPVNNRLLVFFRGEPIGTYYAYHPDDNSWERIPDPSRPAWATKHLLLADGGLFFIYQPKFYNVFKVYDSVAREWLNVDFTEPFSMWRYKFEAMVYLGNDLICLLHTFPTYDEDRNYVGIVTVCKFRFVRSPTRPELLFTPFPVEEYPLPPRCCLSTHYLPI